MRAAVEILGPHGRPVGRAWVTEDGNKNGLRGPGSLCGSLHGSMLCDVAQAFPRPRAARVSKRSWSSLARQLGCGVGSGAWAAGTLAGQRCLAESWLWKLG